MIVGMDKLCQEIQNIHLSEIQASAHTRIHCFLFAMISLFSPLQEIWNGSDVFLGNAMNGFSFHEALHQ